MGLIDELRAHQGNGSVSPSAFGSDAPINDTDPMSALPFIDAIRSRRMFDFKNQNDYMMSLPVRQANLERMSMTPKPMNLQYGGEIPDSNQMQDAKDAQFDIAKQKASQEGELAKSKLGLEQGDLKVKQGQLALDTEKNKNIYDTKQKELEQKATEAEKKLKLAEDNAAMRQGDMIAQLALKQAQIDANNSRYAADLSETVRMHNSQISANQARTDQIRKAIEDEGYSVEETKGSDFDESGNPRTKITIRKKGKLAAGAVPDSNTKSSGGKVSLIDPNGKSFSVDAAEFNKVGLLPGWSQAPAK